MAAALDDDVLDPLGLARTVCGDTPPPDLEEIGSNVGPGVDTSSILAVVFSLDGTESAGFAALGAGRAELADDGAGALATVVT